MNTKFDNKKRNLVIAVAVVFLAVNIAVLGFTFFGGSGSVSDSDISGSDLTAPAPIEWVGWQDAVVGTNGAALFVDDDLTVKAGETLAAGKNVIICNVKNDRCMIRYGSKIAWVNTSDLDSVGYVRKYEVSDQSTPLPEDISDTELGKRLDEISKEYRCVGVQMAVIKDGKISYLYEYGYANRAAKVDVTADTKFRIASLSKTIVGMGIMSMHDLGILDMDMDVSEYWGSEIKNPSNPQLPITMRSILTHTSSMKDFGYNKRPTSALEHNLSLTSSYMKTAPGSIDSYRYNNSAICAAGAIASRAAGIHFDDYIRQYFFEPLGIDASFHASKIKSSELIAPTYNEGNITMSVKDLNEIKYFGGVGDDYSLYAGGMIISAQDMAKMVCILIGSGEYEDMYYLKDQTVREMLIHYYELDNYDQCLVLRHRDDLLDGRPMYYHNGNLLGVYSLLCFDPESGDGLVLITNGAKGSKLSGGVYNVCGELATAAAELWQ